MNLTRETKGPLKIVIGIATAGRPSVLKATMAMIARQTRTPDRAIVAPAADSDVAGIDLAAFGFEKIVATRGTCTQRNAILTACTDEDVVIFFDDDFFPCRDYLGAVERAFLDEPDVVMTTGTVVTDGIKGPGLPAELGERLIADSEQDPPAARRRFAAYNGYGCNMAIRLKASRCGVFFDERLPQYGWLEDVDFSRRLAQHGRIVKLSDARGVHLGSKIGRSPGLRLGYSQMVNPMYLVKKGTLGPTRAWGQMWRNFGMNLGRSIVPEPYIDRRGRLRGNLLGLTDLLLGRADPARINSFS